MRKSYLVTCCLLPHIYMCSASVQESLDLMTSGSLGDLVSLVDPSKYPPDDEKSKMQLVAQLVEDAIIQLVDDWNDDDISPYLKILCPFRNWARQGWHQVDAKDFNLAVVRSFSHLQQQYDNWNKMLVYWQYVCIRLCPATSLQDISSPVGLTHHIYKQLRSSQYCRREKPQLFDIPIKTRIHQKACSGWTAVAVIDSWNHVYELGRPDLEFLLMKDHPHLVATSWKWHISSDMDKALEEAGPTNWQNADLSDAGWRGMLQTKESRGDLLALGITRYPQLLEQSATTILGPLLGPSLAHLRLVAPLGVCCTIVDLHQYFYRLRRDMQLFWLIPDLPSHLIIYKKEATRETIWHALMMDNLDQVWFQIALQAQQRAAIWYKHCARWFCGIEQQMRPDLDLVRQINHLQNTIAKRSRQRALYRAGWLVGTFEQIDEDQKYWPLDSPRLRIPSFVDV